MNTLTTDQVSEHLQQLPGWGLSGKALVRDYEFKDFAEAFAFVVRTALLAERAGHHPDIEIRYSKVRLSLISHDAGAVTTRDIRLAGELNRLPV